MVQREVDGDGGRNDAADVDMPPLFQPLPEGYAFIFGERRLLCMLKKKG